MKIPYETIPFSNFLILAFPAPNHNYCLMGPLRDKMESDSKYHMFPFFFNLDLACLFQNNQTLGTIHPLRVRPCRPMKGMRISGREFIWVDSMEITSSLILSFQIIVPMQQNVALVLVARLASNSSKMLDFPFSFPLATVTVSSKFIYRIPIFYA